MGRKAEDLGPLKVSKLRTAGMHFVGHVAGLALRISKTGSRSWILRVTVGDKRRDIGLGAYPEISLADAKQIAKDKRQQIRDGIDPVAMRRSAQAALRAEQASYTTFEEAAKQYIDTHKSGWKNAKHIIQWSSSLEMHAYPIIGKLHVRDIVLDHVLKILEPIWSVKTETASRVRGRIEAILDWSKVRGLRTGDNPARWKGNLDSLLPAPSKVAHVKHYKACDWRDCPTFMKDLREIDSTGARALEFLILTNARSGEARGASWAEIDLKHAVWTIPATRMKAKKEHRIPLSAPTIKLLQAIPRYGDNDLIFPSTKGKPFSDMTLTMILRRMKRDFTVHGFRSTFRDWAGETTAFPREVIEHAMAHQLKDKAEAAYARGDMFTKRIGLMNAWASFLDKSAAKSKNFTVINRMAMRHA